MLDPDPDSFGLSHEQHAALIGTRDVLLTACPGSGKTRAVAGRAAWLQGAGVSFASLSHTRVGAGEIAAAVLRAHRTGVATDCFVGTVHAFLARFVLHPFGHSVVPGDVPVLMDEDAVVALGPEGARSIKYRFTLDGNLQGAKSLDMTADTLARVKAFKIETAAQGLVSHDDALYWAWRVLTDMPWIAAALVQRFQEVLVDEAQDCSLLQLACLHAIKDAGLDSLVLVGDFDQSIYGFGGADPQLCDQLASATALTRFRLRENYRSSQLICNTSARFRPDTVPDTAVGEHRAYPVPPMLVRYEPSKATSLPGILDGLCDAAPGDVRSRVVLTRRKAFADEIRGRRDSALTKTALALLEAATLRAGADLAVVREVESLVLMRAYGSPRSRARRVPARRLREAAQVVVANLPPLSGDVGAWYVGALGAVDSVATGLPDSEDPPTATAPAGWREMDAAAFATSEQPRTRVAGVYGVKGESIDAVMLVAEAQAGEWPPPDAHEWARALTRGAARSDEDRVLYVALTRAQRLLFLAVPIDTEQGVIRAFVEAGFEDPEAPR